MPQRSDAGSDVARRIGWTGRIRGYLWTIPFLLLLGGLLVPAYLGVQHLFETAEDFREQELRAGVAQVFLSLAAESREKLPNAPISALYQAGHRFSELYPETDTYILGKDGKILFRLSPYAQSWRSEIDVRPILTFLSQQKLASLPATLSRPLYGDDPVRTDAQEIFSAAPGTSLGLDGFVYIVLQNRIRRLIGIPWLEGGHAIIGGYVLLGALAIVALLIVLIRIIFRRMYLRIASRTGVSMPGADGAAAWEPKISHLPSYELAVMSLFDEMGREQEMHRQRAKEVHHVISSMSHDLRTPLSIIQKYAEQLASEPAEMQAEPPQHGAQLIRRNVQSLVGMLADLDRFFGLRNVDTLLSFETCYLDELCEDLRFLCESIAAEAGVTLVLNVPGAPLPVRVNPLLIERALKNLIENAIRHTPPGGRVILELSTPQPERVRVAVRDSGCGIPEEELGRIFHPYYQVANRNQRNGSSGLGLAIVREALHAHASEIHVVSRVGEGSEFWFELPLIGENRTAE